MQSNTLRPISSAPNTLFRSSCRVVDGFVDARLAALLYRMLLLRHWRGESKKDQQVPSAASHWGDNTLDAVLLTLQPDVEQAIGEALLPTYAYARLYQRGDALPAHRDRAAAEVAVTIHLGHRGAPPPPICFESLPAVSQQPGDAVIYRGDQLTHWREAFSGDDFGQLFVNYVRANGTRRHLLYDRLAEVFPPCLGHVAREGGAA